MSEQPQSHKPEERYEIPEGIVVSYKDGVRDELFQEPGMTLPFNYLRKWFAVNQVAWDHSSVHVQTRNPQTGEFKHYYFNYRGMVAQDKPAERPSAAADLENIALDDRSFDITVGEPWNSPLGATDPVYIVSRPWIGQKANGEVRERPQNRSWSALGQTLLAEHAPTDHQ